MRRRLTVAISAVAGLAILLFAVPLGMLVARVYRDEALLRLERDTVAATRSIDVRQPGSDPVELPRSGDHLGVYNASGRRIAGVGPRRADAAVLQTLRTGKPVDRRGNGTLLVTVPLLGDERLIGAVRAVRDESAARTDVQQAWLLLGGLGAAILMGAMAAAWLIAARLSRPLEALAGAAERLGDGDFSIRAPLTDVPEMDAVARALDATADRLGSLVAREREFAADASHQLRTPLAALRIDLEALQLQRSSVELAAAVGEIDRLQSTVDTLLAVARDVPRDREPVAVQPLLDAARDRWAGQLAEASRPVTVQCVPPSLQARASEKVIAEILEVLVSNAVSHGAGEVRLSARALAGHAALEVADDGEGFGDHATKAFARRTGRGEGHGIGLALARSLAHAEGGRLDVVRPGPRPVMRLTLPGI